MDGRKATDLKAVFFCGDRVAQQAVEFYVYLQGTFLAAAQADDHHLVGLRDEIFAGKQHAVYLVANGRNGVVEVQFPVIALDCASVPVFDQQGAERRVRFRKFALQSLVPFVGQFVIFALKCLANAGQMRVRIGVHARIGGFAGPQSGIVEVDFVGIGATKNRSAHFSIAKYKAFLKILGRLRVPKQVGRLGLSHGRGKY